MHHQRLEQTESLGSSPAVFYSFTNQALQELKLSSQKKEYN